MSREALNVTPVGHPNRARYLDNLGGRLHDRYLRTGNLDDLEEAVYVVREAVAMTPPDHPDCIGRLGNLSVALRDKYLWLRDMSDLESAIVTAREAVKKTPADHPSLNYCLNNLSNGLGSRFEVTRSEEDLQEAIKTARQAIEITSYEHPDTPALLNNLGTKLVCRFELRQDVADLDSAINLAEGAISATPSDHPDLAIYLNDLGSWLGRRYEQNHSLDDLNHAIVVIGAAVKATSLDQPNGHIFVGNLRHWRRKQSEHTNAQQNPSSVLDDTISINKQATIASAEDSVFSHKHESTPSSLTTGEEVERSRSWRPRQTVLLQTQMKLVSKWLHEQPDRQIGSSTTEKIISAQQSHRLPPLIGYSLGATSTSSEDSETSDLSHLPSPESMLELNTRQNNSSNSAHSLANNSVSEDSLIGRLADEYRDSDSLAVPMLESSRFGPDPFEDERAFEQGWMRFSQPEMWLQRLTSLMDQVIEASDLARLTSQPTRLLNTEIHQLVDTFDIQEFLHGKPDPWDSEWHHLQATINGISTNIERMQKFKYCDDSINIIILDSSRPSVARLVRLSIDEIETLIQQIYSTLLLDPSIVEESCYKFLELTGLLSAQTVKVSAVSFKPNVPTSVKLRAFICARHVVQSIDLAIISYCGAHIEPFLSRFKQGNASTQLSIAPGFHLKRRTLKCLDSYLNSPVWVFEIGANLGSDREPVPLYLSTKLHSVISARV